MAGDIKTKYGTTKQAITIKLDCISTVEHTVHNGAVVDNSSNCFIDALVGGKLLTDTGATISTTGYFNVFAYGTVNTTDCVYTAGLPATDCVVALAAAQKQNLRLIGVINATVCATTYNFGPFSVAAAFGGVLPEKWGIAIENRTAIITDTDAANHALWYQGVYAQYT